MGVLADYLKSEAEQLRKAAAQRKQALDEWLKAIDGLYRLLEQWVGEADAGAGLLWASRKTTTLIQEPRLWSYEADTLTIGLGPESRRAFVVPRARYAIAQIRPPHSEPTRADGIVEIRDGATPIYYLFRLKADASDSWFIRSVAEWNALWNAAAGAGDVEPLDRDRFEAAVLSILQ